MTVGGGRLPLNLSSQIRDQPNSGRFFCFLLTNSTRRSRVIKKKRVWFLCITCVIAESQHLSVMSPQLKFDNMDTHSHTRAPLKRRNVYKVVKKNKKCSVFVCLCVCLCVCVCARQRKTDKCISRRKQETAHDVEQITVSVCVCVCVCVSVCVCVRERERERERER